MTELQISAPPLIHGERLSQPVFEHRYEAMPPGIKAELIAGVVHMASPAQVIHGRPQGHIIAWLGVYWFATDGVDLQVETTTRLNKETEIQPVVLMRLEPAAGGTSRVSADGYLEGAPELVVEVAASTAFYDLHSKRTCYQYSGVQEYIIWQPKKQQLDWFVLQDGEYVQLLPDDEGVIRSRVFPGLHLAMDALLNGDRKRLIAVAQQGIATAEHAAFVQQHISEHLPSAPANG